MTKIEVPAARVRQGDLTLYTTALKVRDLIAPNFYTVETLDPAESDDHGFQRVLNAARAKKLADYIVKGQERRDSFLPTSVFLATDKSFDFNTGKNVITFDTEKLCPFSVVDGQHRLEGLKMAAQKDIGVLEFEVPVNIAVGLSKIAQMCHFLIVNTTQKSVDKSVEQRIISRLTRAIDLEDIPSLPRWIQNVVQKGEVDRAVKLVDFLNTAAGSPWQGKIAMANDDKTGTSINQRSLVTIFAKYILTPSNPINIFKDFDREKQVLVNYWKAIAELLDDGSETVLYKTNGAELFSLFSIPFFTKCHDRGRFSVDAMKELLESCFEQLEGDFAGLGHPDWWAKGGTAGSFNRGAIGNASKELTEALHRVSLKADVEF